MPKAKVSSIPSSDERVKRPDGATPHTKFRLPPTTVQLMRRVRQSTGEPWGRFLYRLASRERNRLVKAGKYLAGLDEPSTQPGEPFSGPPKRSGAGG